MLNKVKYIGTAITLVIILQLGNCVALNLIDNYNKKIYKAQGITEGYENCKNEVANEQLKLKEVIDEETAQVQKEVNENYKVTLADLDCSKFYSIAIPAKCLLDTESK